MCMLIWHPKDAEPFTRAEFADFHRRNPHGWGAAWIGALHFAISSGRPLISIDIWAIYLPLAIHRTVHPIMVKLVMVLSGSDVQCEYCGKSFFVEAWRLRRNPNEGRFCSYHNFPSLKSSIDDLPLCSLKIVPTLFKRASLILST